jgi:hypothetical protein
MSDVKDLYDLQSEDYLSPGDVDRLITDLETAPRSQWEDEASYEADMGTLEELKAFRDEVTGYAGVARWNNGMTLVRDSAWDKFAEEEAESLYGKAAVDSGYLALDRFAQDLLTDYQDASLDGVTFWFR